MTGRLFAVAIVVGALAGCAKCDCMVIDQSACAVPTTWASDLSAIPPEAVFHATGIDDLGLWTEDGVLVSGAVDDAPYGLTFEPATPLSPGLYTLGDASGDTASSGIAWPADVSDATAEPVPGPPAPDDVVQDDVRIRPCCGSVYKAVILEWDEPPDAIAGWEIEAAADEALTEPVHGLSPSAFYACISDRPNYRACATYPLERGRTVWVRVRPIGWAGDLGEWLDPVEVRFGLI